jgi:hypothetical protein
MTRRGAPALLAAGLVAAALLAACASGTSTGRTTFPPFGSTPGPVGGATAATVNAVIGALRNAGLESAETARPHRPPEGPLLAAAPRVVVQAKLPDDPDHGFLVVYELASPAAAQAAATDHAAYISSNVGKVNFPPDSHFVIRVLGSTVVFFTWSPGAAIDGRTHLIEEALGTVGTAVAVPA